MVVVGKRSKQHAHKVFIWKKINFFLWRQGERTYDKEGWTMWGKTKVYIDCLPRTMRLLALGCSCRFGCDRYGSIQIRMLTYRGWLERPSQILEHRDTDIDTDTDMGCCVFCVHFQIFAASSSHLIHVVIPPSRYLSLWLADDTKVSIGFYIPPPTPAAYRHSNTEINLICRLLRSIRNLVF